MLPVLCIALTSLVGVLPSGNQLTPERLLSPAEFVLNVSGAGAWSNTTLPPSGGPISEAYSESHLGLNMRAGVARFLSIELNVPLLTHYDLQNGRLGTMRVGDPTLGALLGHRFRSAAPHGGAIDLAALGELQTPSDGNISLRVRDLGDSPLQNNLNRGAVITTGGVTARIGAMFSGSIRLAFARVAASARGYYRIRSNGASDAIGFDVRLKTLWAEHIILGGMVSGSFAMNGSNRAFISASREGDGASFADAGLLIGLRTTEWLDLYAAFLAPIHSASAGTYVQAHLGLEFRYQAPL